MKAKMPERAMVLAAGLGERMRPLTEHKPKPLIEVRGRNMLDRVLDRLAAAGVPEAVVNLHYLGEQIESHLAERRHPAIVFSNESDQLMETGGGVTRALPLLGKQPFFVINGDIVWLDGPVPALERLAAAWDPKTMDILLLLHPVSTAFGYEGQGDFHMNLAGRLQRRGEREIAPFIFAGVQLLHPKIFRDVPETPYSLNLLYDRAIEAGRLWGLRHDGEWFHIGTPQGLAEVEEALHHLNSGSVQR